MGLKVINAPPVEPVTLDELKDHLKIINDYEDSILESLIKAAREVIEKETNRSFVQQTLLLTFDTWPVFPIELKKPPLVAVTKLEYKTKEGSLLEWDPFNYLTDDYSFIPKIYLSSQGAFPGDELYPANAVQVTYSAGYETVGSDYTSNIPEIYKHAIKLLAGEWYGIREEVVMGSKPSRIPDGIKRLLAFERVVPT